MAKNVIAFYFVSAVISAKIRFHFFAFCEKIEAPYLLFADYVSNDCLTVV